MPCERVFGGMTVLVLLASLFAQAVASERVEPRKAAAATLTAQAPRPDAAPVPKPVKPGDKGTVRVAIVPVVSLGPYMIAREKGFFEEEGIRIEEMLSRNSAVRLQATISGNVDFASTGFDADVISAIQQGAPLRIVLPIAREREGFTFNWWLIRKDLWDSGQVRDFKDFKGRRITVGTARASVSDMLLRLALKQAGLTVGDITFVVMNHPEVPAALAAKAVDIAESLDPFAQAAIDRGHAHRLRSAVSAFPGGVLDLAVLIMNTSFYRDKPELARGFVRAWLRGAEFFNAALQHGRNRDEFNRILAKFSELPLEVLGKIGYPEVPPDGRLNEPSVLRMMDFFFEEKAIPRKVNAVSEITEYGVLPSR